MEAVEKEFFAALAEESTQKLNRFEKCSMKQQETRP
jgi:hypothetical protein